MPPRALLFSSDEQTSTLLTRALAELAIQAEACPDIFAAVEKLTTRNYQIIIADWAQTVEAGFFLKAARELVFSQATFTLALVREKDTAAAFQTGVNGILAKPITAEQAKNTFLAALNAISVAPSTGEQELPPEPHRETEPAPLPYPCFEAGPAALSAEAPGSEEHAFRDLVQTRRPLSFAGYVQASPPKHLGRRLVPVAVVAAVAAMALGGWKLGHGFNRGAIRRIAGSVAKAAEAKQVLAAPEPAATTRPVEAVARQEAVAAAYGFDDSAIENKPISRAQIRVRPVLPLAQNPESKPAFHRPSDSTVPLPAKVNPEIPDSLSVPVQTMAAHTVPVNARAGDNQWTVGPLELPEEISRHLVLHRVLPIYPAKALEAGLEGAVVLRAWVGQDGSIRDLKLVRGYLVLAEAAFQAVKQWRYQPYQQNGEIVEIETFITVDFQRP
jgi:TonB family protein